MFDWDFDAYIKVLNVHFNHKNGIFCTSMVQILYTKMRKRFRRLKKIATIAEASFIVKSDFYDNKHFFLQMFMR